MDGAQFSGFFSKIAAASAGCVRTSASTKFNRSVRTCHNFRLALRACAGLALLLTGCARFEPAPISAARSAEQLEARSLADPDLTAFVVKHSGESGPTNVWNLEKLTLAAFYYSPDLAVARTQWAVARGGETTAAQRPNPTLTVAPGYDTTPSSLSPWIPVAMLDIPIETAGKRKFRRAHSAQLSEAARLNLATAAWQVRSNVRTGLLQLSGAIKHEQGVQRTLGLYEAILKALSEQVKLGAISRSELTVYDIAIQKARLDAADAARQKSESRAKLAEAIGIPLRALDGVSLTTPEPAINGQLTSSEARRAALLGP